MSNWVVVYKSNNTNNAHIVKSVLEDNGIDAVVVDKMDSMHTHLMNGEIELHVNSENVVKAKHIISKNDL